MNKRSFKLFICNLFKSAQTIFFVIWPTSCGTRVVHTPSRNFNFSGNPVIHNNNRTPTIPSFFGWVKHLSIYHINLVYFELIVRVVWSHLDWPSKSMKPPISYHCIICISQGLYLARHFSSWTVFLSVKHLHLGLWVTGKNS